MIIYILTPPTMLIPKEFAALQKLHARGAMAFALRTGLYTVQQICLAKSDEKIVGWAMLTREWDVHVYVEPAYRKANVGSMLIRTLCQPYRHKDLFAYPRKFTKGRAFYARLGFVSTGCNGTEMRLDAKKQEEAA